MSVHVDNMCPGFQILWQQSREMFTIRVQRSERSCYECEHIVNGFNCWIDRYSFGQRETCGCCKQGRRKRRSLLAHDVLGQNLEAMFREKKSRGHTITLAKDLSYPGRHFAAVNWGRVTAFIYLGKLCVWSCNRGPLKNGVCLLLLFGSRKIQYNEWSHGRYHASPLLSVAFTGIYDPEGKSRFFRRAVGTSWLPMISFPQHLNLSSHYQIYQKNGNYSEISVSNF